jgi:hypothetical protein
MKPSKYLSLIIILSVIIFSACEKRDVVPVKYIATEAIADYEISYRDQNGDLIKKTVAAQSVQDKWEYNFVAEEGEIVYISGKYNDINSSLRLMIVVDGKIYKQGFSTGDTLKYLTVSGVVPY